MSHEPLAPTARHQELVLLAAARLFRYQLTALTEPGCLSLRRLLKERLIRTLVAVERDVIAPATPSRDTPACAAARAERVRDWLAGAAWEDPAEAALLDVVLYDLTQELQTRLGPAPAFVQELAAQEDLDSVATALLDLAVANGLADVPLSPITVPPEHHRRFLACAIDADEEAVAQALREGGPLDLSFLLERPAADAGELGEYLAFNDFGWHWLADAVTAE